MRRRLPFHLCLTFFALRCRRRPSCQDGTVSAWIASLPAYCGSFLQPSSDLIVQDYPWHRCHDAICAAQGEEGWKLVMGHTADLRTLRYMNNLTTLFRGTGRHSGLSTVRSTCADRVYHDVSALTLSTAPLRRTCKHRITIVCPPDLLILRTGNWNSGVSHPRLTRSHRYVGRISLKLDHFVLAPPPPTARVVNP